MDTFEVELNKGFGTPIYVDAEDVNEAMKKAVGAYRKGCTALDFLTAEQLIKEVRICSKQGVQYV